MHCGKAIVYVGCILISFKFKVIQSQENVCAFKFLKNVLLDLTITLFSAHDKIKLDWDLPVHLHRNEKLVHPGFLSNLKTTCFSVLSMYF